MKHILLFTAFVFTLSSVNVAETKSRNLWFSALASNAKQQNLPDLGRADLEKKETLSKQSTFLEEKAFQLAANTSAHSLSGVKSFLTQTLKEQITGALQENLDLPEWAKRIEVQFDLETEAKPVYSIRTVQPLYQSADKVNTFFTQLRYARHTDFDLRRHTSNIGLGYRRLLLDNTVMLGANVHYDREWRRSHSRLGVGLEARWSGADIFLNRYQGLSSERTVSSTVTEDIMDGWDVQALLQVPYIPSTRVMATGSRWKKSANDYINGWRAGLESDLTPFTQISLGASNDNDQSDPEFFVNFRVSLGGYGHKRPTLLGENSVSKVAWERRDMSNYTLDRVRREENIRLKQTNTAGRVVVRGY
jgi:hypothetical protein